MNLTPEELRSLQRLAENPSTDTVPDEHIQLFRDLGLVRVVPGGQGWRPSVRGQIVILDGGRIGDITPPA